MNTIFNGTQRSMIYIIPYLKPFIGNGYHILI